MKRLRELFERAVRDCGTEYPGKVWGGRDWYVYYWTLQNQCNEPREGRNTITLTVD